MNTSGEDVGCCSTCFSRYVSDCIHCGTYQVTSNDECVSCDRPMRDDFDGDRDDDYDSDYDPDSGMQSHSYRPVTKFIDFDTKKMVTRQYSKDDRSVYMGMELEIETRSNSNRSKTCSLLTKVTDSYCKEDGSLHDYGVEWVTQPHTPAAWRALEPKLTEALNTLRSNGARSYNTTTCGLHIHVSRQAFNGTAHVFKLLSLIYHNPRFILKLSGRGTMDRMEQWAGFSDCPIHMLPRKVKAQEDGSEEFRRYAAVNLNNSHTLEFRFFKGTLAVDGVYRALEFVEASTEYTRNISLEDSAHLPKFRKYVMDNKKRFPRLSEWWARIGNTESSVSTSTNV